MADDLWKAFQARAKDVDGISGPEAIRRLAVRYVLGEVKAGPKKEWGPVRAESAERSDTPDNDQR
ncbi:hypothetical protein [Nonomuraea coxensis]|nr:hypothetical protein [Nonomuraea coxensis]